MIDANVIYNPTSNSYIAVCNKCGRSLTLKENEEIHVNMSNEDKKYRCLFNVPDFCPHCGYKLRDDMNMIPEEPDILKLDLLTIINRAMYKHAKHYDVTSGTNKSMEEYIAEELIIAGYRDEHTVRQEVSTQIADKIYQTRGNNVDAGWFVSIREICIDVAKEKY